MDVFVGEELECRGRTLLVMAPAAAKTPSWRTPLLVGVAVSALVVATALGTWGMDLRSDMSAAADRTQAALDVASAAPGAGPRRLALDVAEGGVAVRVLGPAPARPVIADAGPATSWSSGSPDWYANVATLGMTEIFTDAVQASRSLPNGRAVVVRAALPSGTTTLSSAALLTGGLTALVAGLLAAGFVRRRQRRAARAIARLTAAARTVAVGSGTLSDLPGGELEAASAAVMAVRDRMAEMQAVAESQTDGIDSLIRPLAAPVVARTAAGRISRSTALDTLLTALVPEDRQTVSSAVDELLVLTGRPAGRRLELTGARVLDAESWAIPGGRVVAIVERGEQERLRRLRRQLTGAAARHLRAPLAEIEARATELFTHVPAASAAPVQRILAAADRMDRLVTSMLRGTAHDPQARPPRLGPMSVSGLLWGLAQKWDRSLRPQALRVELDIADDLPPAQADAALVEEILTELIDNAAKYTPRGGTIELRGRAGADGATILEVRDTGDGIEAAEVGSVTQPFYRGARSEVLPGAGLGLGVARALAERIGGRLEIRPGPGGRVALHLRPASAAAEKKVTASVA
jgi:signal transduction histidine kinase